MRLLVADLPLLDRGSAEPLGCLECPRGDISAVHWCTSDAAMRAPKRQKHMQKILWKPFANLSQSDRSALVLVLGQVVDAAHVMAVSQSRAVPKEADAQQGIAAVAAALSSRAAPAPAAEARRRADVLRPGDVVRLRGLRPGSRRCVALPSFRRRWPRILTPARSPRLSWTCRSPLSPRPQPMPTACSPGRAAPRSEAPRASQLESSTSC